MMKTEWIDEQSFEEKKFIRAEYLKFHFKCPKIKHKLMFVEKYIKIY